MDWVIMITATGDVRRFETLIQNEASQVFNLWHSSKPWLYLARGNDYKGIYFSLRQFATAETKDEMP